MTTPARETPQRDPKRAAKESRRSFLQGLLMAAGALTVAMLGFVPVLGNWLRRLRPPGALEERRFLAACIKCGQCVQVCPVEAIELAGAGDGLGVGAPFIDARAQACDFSCDVMQCVLACPTGALSHGLDFPHQTEMGVARLTSPDSCLAARGEGVQGPARGPDFTGTLRYQDIDRWNPLPVRDHDYDLDSCDLCVRQCPIEIQLAQTDATTSKVVSALSRPPEHAIRMVPLPAAAGEPQLFQPEVLDGCVGCGVCEMICPAEPAAITVTPAIELRAEA